MAERRIRFFSLAELRERVERRPPRFLIEELWPEDAYGVLGAEDKAGKTWAILDAGVSIATGTPWLGRFECIQGRVLVLFGEGGERNLIRRLDAICRSRGATLDELIAADVIRVALAVPRLDRPEQLEDVARELEEFVPRATLLDPLYLAAGAGKGRDLYAMGEALSEIQQITQEASSALLVNTHWNKNGEGGGPTRFTGVGPGAWGRVLGSAEVEQRHTDPDGKSTATLRWEFTGGEIPDLQFRMVRRVWVDDTRSLGSAMHYEAEVVAEGGMVIREGDLTNTQRRVLQAIRQLCGQEGEMTTAVRIGDVVAADSQGYALKKRTIQQALSDLADTGLADSLPEEGKESKWWPLRDGEDRA